MTLRKRAEPKPNSVSQAEIATLPCINRKERKFVIVCKLYLKIRMKKSIVEEQV